MNKVTHAEAITGSLLDRLSNRSTEQIADATVSRGELQATSPRESILRNLQWLLNTTRLESSVDLSRWPHIQRSVLNFGIPEFSGQTLCSMDAGQLERQLAEAIALFEPRLERGSVQVQALLDGGQVEQRSVTLVITGACIESLDFAPVHITAQMDIESGQVASISD